MRLENVGARFQGYLKTITGKKFRGLVLGGVVMPTSGLNDYVLRVAKDSVVNLGDVIFYDDDKYIVAFGQTESQNEPLFRLHRLIFVSHELAWARSTVILDPVSQLAKQTGEDKLGTAYASVSAAGTIGDIFKAQNSRYHGITPSAVMVNDRLGEFTVTFVEPPRLGVYFCELR